MIATEVGLKTEDAGTIKQQKDKTIFPNKNQRKIIAEKTLDSHMQKI